MSEHYVTLFNHKFLPQGMALHESMQKHCGNFVLWIICVDDLVYDQLALLSLGNVRLLKISEIEDKRLLKVQKNRSLAEFCWTLTPLSFSYVMDADPSINRVTYLDADLYFYNTPEPLFYELESNYKDVLITEHAYDPSDDRSVECGRFCVQFLTFTKSEKARLILETWQNQCLESCSSDQDRELFGDQMYLNDWPELYSETVHILEDNSRALGPWNADYLGVSEDNMPVFYHFHSFRIISKCLFLLLISFRVRKAFDLIYPTYFKSVVQQLERLKEMQIAIPYLPYPSQRFLFIYLIKRILCKDNIFKFYRLSR